MSEAAAGLIGAGLGAGGAVLAQIVAQVFSARSEGRRLAWEREQVTHARDEAEGRKFGERRLELFVDLLELIRHTEGAIHDAALLHGEPRRLFEEWKASASPLLAEIQILAPKVYLEALSAYGALQNLFVALEQSEAGREPFSSTTDQDLQRTVRDLRITMRETLRIPGKDWLVIGPGGNLEPTG